VPRDASAQRWVKTPETSDRVRLWKRSMMNDTGDEREHQRDDEDEDDDDAPMMDTVVHPRGGGDGGDKKALAIETASTTLMRASEDALVMLRSAVEHVVGAESRVAALRHAGEARESKLEEEFSCIRENLRAVTAKTEELMAVMPVRREETKKIGTIDVGEDRGIEGALEDAGRRRV